METTQTFALGSTVKIVSCFSCPEIIGKIVTIKSENSEGLFSLKFGRGRPNANRPQFFSPSDIELVNDSSSF